MTRICENGGFIVQGKYYIYNNLWGAATGSGSQCTWGSTLDGSNIAWGTRWNWTGQKDAIKSYAAVVLGWHWGWKVADTGLPIRLSSVKSARTSWEFDLTHRTHGGTNVSYDVWLSDDPHHGREDPTGEVMIWLYNTGDIRPIGSKQANATIEGTSWDLWEGRHPESGWPVCSFVRVANTREESLDLMAFFRHLASVGQSTPGYLLGVEAGAEVFAGEGELGTTRYSVDVECR